MAVRQRAIFGDEVTHVVVDRDWRIVAPIESYLEHLRQERYSPHTVRAYSGGLALWWSMLEDRNLDWREVDVQDLARFKRRLANRGTDPEVIELRPCKPPAASTVDGALTAVLGFYRYQALTTDLPAVQRFYERLQGGPGMARQRYSSFLGHVGNAQKRRVVGRRRDPKSPPPFLTPRQIDVIKADAAHFDRETAQWRGDLRMRLFWTLLEETGLRLSEALLLRHRDWHPGTGATAVLEVHPREDTQRRLRVKNQQYRRIYLSDDLATCTGNTSFSSSSRGSIFTTMMSCSSTCSEASSAGR